MITTHLGVIRPYRDSDRGMVIGSWRQQITEHEIAVPRRSALVHSASDGIVHSFEDLISESNTIVHCGSHDHDVIHGWACFGSLDGYPVIHNVYVKHIYREIGIERLLMLACGANDEHDTRAMITFPSSSLSRLCREYSLRYAPHVAMIPSTWTGGVP